MFKAFAAMLILATGLNAVAQSHYDLPKAGEEIDQLVFREVLTRLGSINLDLDGHQINLADFLSLRLLSQKKTAVSLANVCRIAEENPATRFSCQLTVATVARNRKDDMQKVYKLIYRAGGDKFSGITLPRRIQTVDQWSVETKPLAADVSTDPADTLAHQDKARADQNAKAHAAAEAKAEADAAKKVAEKPKVDSKRPADQAKGAKPADQAKAEADKAKKGDKKDKPKKFAKKSKSKYDKYDFPDNMPNYDWYD